MDKTLEQIIEIAIGNFEFDNEDNYSIDFGLDTRSALVF